jgi:LPXTG-site transpeptidase (sortase) family protein
VSSLSSPGGESLPEAGVGLTVSEPRAAPDRPGSAADLTVETDDAAGDPSAGAVPVSAGRAPLSPATAVFGAALSILGALLLGFGADLTFVGALHHNRDQHLAYDDFRAQLAHGEAPIGPADQHDRPLAMGAPVALLDIPEIGLREVVLEGTTSRVLAMGAAHARSTVFPGQAGTSVIMGRRAAFGGPFRRIASLRPQQTFTVTTGQGVSTYRVIDVRRAGDPVPAAVAVGAGRMQLVTAGGPAFQPGGVVRVDADLVTPVQGTPTVDIAIPPLPKAEQPLQGDPSVLMVLVLWAQALLLAAGLVAWARLRWGFWQTWIVGVPLLAALGLATADRVAQLLPNLM